MNTNLNKIKTKYGTIYIESLNGNREKQDRIKIFDSDKKYIDYFSIETLENYARERGITIEEEYAGMVWVFKKITKLYELLHYISKNIINWTDNPLEFAALLNADGVTEIYSNVVNNDFVNRIGDIYTLSRE